ncbi:MAG: hypothetical protein WD512_16925 [Candidatus Paceibacterota bacterium]
MKLNTKHFTIIINNLTFNYNLNTYNYTITNMDNETSINVEQLKLLFGCTNKGTMCLQSAPVLETDERNNHIKNCEYDVVKCYLDIILNDKNIKCKIMR